MTDTLTTTVTEALTVGERWHGRTIARFRTDRVATHAALSVLLSILVYAFAVAVVSAYTAPTPAEIVPASTYDSLTTFEGVPPLGAAITLAAALPFVALTDAIGRLWMAWFLWVPVPAVAAAIVVATFITHLIVLDVIWFGFKRVGEWGVARRRNKARVLAMIALLVIIAPFNWPAPLGDTPDFAAVGLIASIILATAGANYLAAREASPQ